MGSTPPESERIELKVLQPVNLRADASKESESVALLAKDALIWHESQEGDFYEVWVHGYVHKSFVKVVTS
jgi:hypothetical protein